MYVCVCEAMPMAVSWGRLSHIKFNFDLKILIENEYKTTKAKKRDMCGLENGQKGNSNTNKVKIQFERKGGRLNRLWTEHLGIWLDRGWLDYFGLSTKYACIYV